MRSIKKSRTAIKIASLDKNNLFIRLMVLFKLPVAGRPTIWMIVAQGHVALVVGAGGVCLDIFTVLYLFFSLSASL